MSISHSLKVQEVYFSVLYHMPRVPFSSRKALDQDGVKSKRNCFFLLQYFVFDKLAFALMSDNSHLNSLTLIYLQSIKLGAV